MGMWLCGVSEIEVGAAWCVCACVCVCVCVCVCQILLSKMAACLPLVQLSIPVASMLPSGRLLALRGQAPVVRACYVNDDFVLA